MKITTKESASGKILGYYVDGQKVRKCEIETLARRTNEVVEIDYFTAKNFPDIYRPCDWDKIVYTGFYGKILITKAAAEYLGVKIGKGIGFEIYYAESEIPEIETAEVTETVEVKADVESSMVIKMKTNTIEKTHSSIEIVADTTRGGNVKVAVWEYGKGELKSTVAKVAKEMEQTNKIRIRGNDADSYINIRSYEGFQIDATGEFVFTDITKWGNKNFGKVYKFANAKDAIAKIATGNVEDNFIFTDENIIAIAYWEGHQDAIDAAAEAEIELAAENTDEVTEEAAAPIDFSDMADMFTPEIQDEPITFTLEPITVYETEPPDYSGLDEDLEAETDEVSETEHFIQADNKHEVNETERKIAEAVADSMTAAAPDDTWSVTFTDNGKFAVYSSDSVNVVDTITAGDFLNPKEFFEQFRRKPTQAEIDDEREAALAELRYEREQLLKLRDAIIDECPDEVNRLKLLDEMLADNDAELTALESLCTRPGMFNGNPKKFLF